MTAIPLRSPGLASTPVRLDRRQAVVTVDGLSKRFGRVLAVDNLTFSLEHGTVTGFLGPNGAGKTTTLRMLLGLAKPSGALPSSLASATRRSRTRLAESAQSWRQPTSILAAPAGITC